MWIPFVKAAMGRFSKRITIRTKANQELSLNDLDQVNGGWRTRRRKTPAWIRAAAAAPPVYMASVLQEQERGQDA
jgi:hypothetical protein